MSSENCFVQYNKCACSEPSVYFDIESKHAGGLCVGILLFLGKAHASTAYSGTILYFLIRVMFEQILFLHPYSL